MDFGHESKKMLKIQAKIKFEKVTEEEKLRL